MVHPLQLWSAGQLLISLPLLLQSYVSAASQCRCFPGDACWPSQADWSNLNNSVNGKLIATGLPLGSPCHDPTYDAARCQAIQQNWLDPAEHYTSSYSIMASYFANKSCDAFTPRSTPCTLGNYNHYAINVSQPSDIVKGIAFAKEHNIRLVIRNTGHDYNGKSVGAGSLAIWTHNLKDLQFFDYKSPYYTGKAYRTGAGIQGFEIYEASQKLGLTVTSGECPSVGVAGGYTQGGGHSLLASKYGLGADQTLSFSVVTSSGSLLTASPSQNPDLYWALSGGGGGTYAVVYSLTAKAHPDIPVAGANLSFTSQGIGADKFWDAIAVYHKWVPSIVDEGAVPLIFGSNTSFSIGPVIAPGMELGRLKAHVKELTDQFDDMGVNYTTPFFELFPGYWPAAQKMMPPIAVNVHLYGGRLIPRSVVEGNPHAVINTFRNITNHANVVYVTLGMRLDEHVTGKVDNAVLPAWREIGLDSVFSIPTPANATMDELLGLQRQMTDFVDQLKAITPGSGCYLNEGDFLDRDWKQTFYGANYDRLRAIKAKYDPDDVFYGSTAVGSDEWVLGDGGRLCRA